MKTPPQQNLPSQFSLLLFPASIVLYGVFTGIAATNVLLASQAELYGPFQDVLLIFAWKWFAAFLGYTVVALVIPSKLIRRIAGTLAAISIVAALVNFLWILWIGFSTVG